MNSLTAIDFLPKTASKTIKKFRSIGIHTYGDLINYFPFRYEVNAPPISIAHAKKMAYGSSFNSPLLQGDNEEGASQKKVTIRGTIRSIKNIYARNGFKIQRAELADDTGSIELTWFNQIYLLRVLYPGAIVQVAGTPSLSGQKITVQVHEYELLPNIESSAFHTAHLAPVYTEKNGLSTRVFREKIRLSLGLIGGDITESLPAEIIKKNNLLDEKTAYQLVHFPVTQEQANKARERLAFDELFTIQLSSKIIKKQWDEEVTTKPFAYGETEKKLIDKVIEELPFVLTTSQKKATDEILADLSRSIAMNRLLQGDVGSGKTVVAALACYLTVLNKMTTLFMAPTEILAEQHYKTLTTLFGRVFKIVLFTSSKKPKGDEFDNADIIVGTHALIAKKVDFKHIGLVIIDEQHKFGVAQRATLKNKAGNPHLLTMTATPIPRTVLLTLYGELDVSVIAELPTNRIPIKTFLVPLEKRASGNEWIIQQIKTHDSQAFIVCPFIEESAVESIKNVKAAKVEFDRLSTTVFKYLRLGLLHGRLKAAEKNAIMAQFGSGEIDILVTTPVVEVGIDFPNATIIVIEGSERFGLAQLHQLRGRVGRGTKQSYCLLFNERDGQYTHGRLSFFCKNASGYELAEYDLKARGAGDMYGTRQHGMSDLNIASLSNFELIAKTDRATSEFMSNFTLDDYPLLQERIKSYQQKSIARD